MLGDPLRLGRGVGVAHGELLLEAVDAGLELAFLLLQEGGARVGVVASTLEFGFALRRAGGGGGVRGGEGAVTRVRHNAHLLVRPLQLAERRQRHGHLLLLFRELRTDVGQLGPQAADGLVALDGLALGRLLLELGRRRRHGELGNLALRRRLRVQQPGRLLVLGVEPPPQPLGLVPQLVGLVLEPLPPYLLDAHDGGLLFGFEGAELAHDRVELLVNVRRLLAEPVLALDVSGGRSVGPSAAAPQHNTERT